MPRLPFGAATEDERRTQTVRIVIPQRQFQVVTFDFDAAVVVNGNDLHFDNRLPVLVRLLPLNPMHEVAGAVRTAGTILRHRSYSRHVGPPPSGGALADTGLVPAASSSEPPSERGVGVPSSRS